MTIRKRMREYERERKLRMIIRVNKIITLTMKTMRVARLIMRMIKAMRVKGVNIIITIKLQIGRAHV